MTITLQAVNELIASLESAGELSIKETKVMALAKAFKQLASENVALALENVAMKQIVDSVTNLDNDLSTTTKAWGADWKTEVLLTGTMPAAMAGMKLWSGYTAK